MYKKKSKNKEVVYYLKHKNKLNKIIKEYSNALFEKDMFAYSNDISLYNAIESGVTKYKLRYYQFEALFVMDYLYAQAQAEKIYSQLPAYKENKLITDLMEIIDKDNNFNATFLGFEMATGSGKTMLMGAALYILNKKYGVKNFLIIAPSSLDIYQKTIRNFSIGESDSIWADDSTFSFNLVTGENYNEKLFIDYNRDANIFVFNIDKFGANAINTEKTWESSAWRDENGNTISIKEYLSKQKLVIITDEAHHTQGNKSLNIIKKFHPEAVLEYTATAIESSKTNIKRNQQIVYKYDIRKFLEDGHGKLVRAVALAGESNNSNSKNNEILVSEKYKLVTLLLIHIVKKYAVLKDPKIRSIKPIAFIKVKNDTRYTQKIFDYIQNFLAEDIDNINTVIEKVFSQELEITDFIKSLITDKFNDDIEKLRQEIENICSKTIFYHSKSDKITVKRFSEIKKNDIELLVYMEKLDEGIDLPNIYSMAVINDKASNFITSVKQIIGRGVRLAKEKREFDNSDKNQLKKQAEKLHIVCDQGKNFEEVILSVQNEFGLTDKYLSMDKPKVPVYNKSKSERLDKRYLPHIGADLRAKKGVSLINLISDIDDIIKNFLDQNCFSSQEDSSSVNRYLKYRPEAFFIEVDLFADRKVYFEQLRNSGADFEDLHITSKQTNAIYGIVQRSLFCLPDTKIIYSLFEKYIFKLNEIKLKYPKLDEGDAQLALNFVVHNFAFFYKNHIEKKFYDLDFYSISSEDYWNLKTHFSDYQLKIPKDQVEKNKLHQVHDPDKIIELIKSHYNFYGYKHSIYDYVNFDALTEKQFADYADALIDSNFDNSAKPFWVRNERQIYFSYGNHKYYPDFIMFYAGILFVVETKGELYSDSRKKILLAELEKYDNCKGVLVFSDVMDEIDGGIPNIHEFLSKAEESLKRYQSKQYLESNPSEEDKYNIYIPAYLAHKAYKKIIRDQRTAIEGWLQVKPKGHSTYPKSIFAVQVKGDSLLPKYKNNDWIILNSGFELKDCENNIVLIRYDEIDDVYQNNLTIRQLEIESKNIQEGLFKYTKHTLILKALNENDDIIIQDINPDSIEIVAVEKVNN